VRANVARTNAGVTIDVSDDGPGSGSNGASGHGLIGMRERVSLYGGLLEAGTAPGGGWTIHAELPIEGG
jgi:signal transduction histidine kinase